jgi:Fuc2NAc and GlcNAc transferase
VLTGVRLSHDCMRLALAAIAVSVLLVAALITRVARKFALLHGVIDVPNERSSHLTPTPRGGGVSIVVAATTGLIALTWLGAMRTPLLLAVGGGGLAVAIVGFLDDRRRLSVGIRFAIHLAAALWALSWLGGLPPLRVGAQIVTLGWSGYVLGMLAIVWVLNLFNFMDGIDGLAAVQGVFVTWGGALLAIVAGVHGEVAGAALVLGAACCGFVRWNWPPAKIFMGDVGSGYLGYVIAVLALAATRENPVALWAWLTLGGVFFVDATVTLLRRLLRGERVYEAHRSHAYQWLARRWRSHAKVTGTVLTVNVLWLLPCAVFATRRPGFAAATALFALAPLVLLAIAVSGRREASDRRHLKQ